MTTERTVRFFTRIPSKDGILQERSEHACFKGVHYFLDKRIDDDLFMYEERCACKRDNPFVSILSKEKQEKMLEIFNKQFGIKAILPED